MTFRLWCSTTMRRVFITLSVALLSFGAGTLSIRHDTPKKIATSSSSGSSMIAPPRAFMLANKETFSCPSAAAEKFNADLQKASFFTEFTPCFDPGGRRIGERAVTLRLPPHAPEPTWRIIRTQQAKDSSTSLWVESVSLSDAYYFEEYMAEHRGRCITTK